MAAPRMIAHRTGARCLSPRGTLPLKKPLAVLLFSALERSCASQSAHIMWPFCEASCAGVEPVVSAMASACAGNGGVR
jgi:hypothetical protein